MTDHRNVHRSLAVVAAILGALAAAAGDPSENRSVGFVTAIDVARWIRDGHPSVRVVDIRADSLFDAYHVPGAERISISALATRSWSPGEHVVVYATDDAEARRAAAMARRRGAAEADVLHGGLVAWVDQIVQPRLEALAPTATAEEQRARRAHLELSRYFGGMPVVGQPAAAGRGARAERASEAAAVARVLRRGC
jgi:rhodanese-related sulfurtransferase